MRQILRNKIHILDLATLGNSEQAPSCHKSRCVLSEAPPLKRM